MDSPKRPKILISTGIYPPAIGGPAEYAKNLQNSFQKSGFEVGVKTYGIEKKLPTGIRHIYYFFKIIPSVIRADYIISLDTFSVGLPTVFASRFFFKTVVIRTGGDFLWESYLERTGKPVLLRDFYKSSSADLNLKEKIIFHLTKYALRSANAIIWSTSWQRDIFMSAYALRRQKHFIIENYYGRKEDSTVPLQKIFLAATRDLVWKNHARLKKAFKQAKQSAPEIILDITPVRHEEFLKKVKNCYAVILVSLGDISPNMILDAIRFNKPFILTRETGLYEKLKDTAVFADPLSVDDIEQKIIYLSDSSNYEKQKEKVENFSFVHTYEDIAEEFLDVYEQIR